MFSAGIFLSRDFLGFLFQLFSSGIGGSLNFEDHCVQHAWSSLFFFCQGSGDAFLQLEGAGVVESITRQVQVLGHLVGTQEVFSQLSGIPHSKGQSSQVIQVVTRSSSANFPWFCNMLIVVPSFLMMLKTGSMPHSTMSFSNAARQSETLRPFGSEEVLKCRSSSTTPALQAFSTGATGMCRP